MTRAPTRPPGPPSLKAHGLIAAAARGEFALQRCGSCGRFLYPVREACPHCLSAALAFEIVPAGGVCLADSRVHVATDPYFAERGPWHAGLVAMDCGVRLLAHMPSAAVSAGDPVTVRLMLDRAGQAVFFAMPTEGEGVLENDPQWREFIARPRGRRVLVTDAQNPLGAAMVRGLQSAGASHIFAGGADATTGGGIVEPVPLDVGDDASVDALARRIGDKVDILVSTADHVSPGRVSGIDMADAAETFARTAFGLMRLGRAFAPAMVARGDDGAAAWVNVIPVHALAGSQAFAAHAAAHAAAVSLSLPLRAELAAGGVRMLNAYTGPLDIDAYRTLPPPKVAPAAAAAQIVAALENGLEEITIGPVAEAFRARLAASPKAVERDMGR